jgi:hypothetical protein
MARMRAYHLLPVAVAALDFLFLRSKEGTVTSSCSESEFLRSNNLHKHSRTVFHNKCQLLLVAFGKASQIYLEVPTILLVMESGLAA